MAQPVSARTSTSTVALAVAGVTLVGLLLRLRGLSESLFGDELFTYEIATRDGLGAVIDGVRSDLEITPPLFFVVAWLAQQAGDPMLWLRIPSLVAGVATIPFVYLLGARTVGRRAALVGAGFFSISPLATYYAVEARAYAVATLFVVLAGLALLRAVESDGWRWWGAFALASAAAMYSHYTTAFVLAAQAGWVVLCHRRVLGRLLVSGALAVVAFAPWLPALLEDRDAIGQAAMARLAPFTWANALEALGRLAGGGPYAPLSDLPGTAGRWALGLAVLVAVAGAGRLIAGRRSGPPAASLALVALWALAAPVGAAVYSAVGGDLFLARNLITSLPALALLVAALLLALPNPARTVGVGLAVAGLGLGALAAFSPSTQRPGVAAAARYIEGEARPGDVVLELRLSPGVPNQAFAVHLDADLPRFTFVQQEAALQQVEATGGRIFFVRPVAEGAPAPSLLERSMEEVDRRAWDGIYAIEVVVYAPPEVPWRIVFDGQSLNNLPDPPGNFPTLVLDALDLPGYNAAVNQLSWTGLATTAAQRLHPYAIGGRTILVMTGGQADLTRDGDTGRKLYEEEVDYANAARAAGFDVIVITTIPPARLLYSGTQPAERLAHNRLLLEDPSGAFDHVVDVAGDPRLADPTGPSFSDGIHPSASGAAVIAELLEPVLASIIRSE